MDIEKLIEEVRKYPVLYDQTNRQYKNTEYKEKVWTAVAKELKATGGVETCKKKWSSVRDHFRRIIQKRKTVSGQAAVNYRKYKFENHLDFLLPHIVERETISNVPFIENNQEDDETNSMIDESQLTEERETETSSPHNEIESVDDDAQISRTSSAGRAASISVAEPIKKKFVKPEVPKRKLRNPEKVQESPSASSQLMEYILSEKRAENEKKQAAEEFQKHPVDAFLAGIAPSLKSLSPLLFHAAKGSIFQVVQEFELKQLMGNQDGPVAQRLAFSPASTSTTTPYPSPVENETRPAPVYQQLHNYQPPEQNNSKETDSFAAHFSDY